MGPVQVGCSGSVAKCALSQASKLVALPKGWTVEDGAGFSIAACAALHGFAQAGVLTPQQHP